MNNETNKTEQLIKIYKEDPVKENLNALVHQIQKTMFFVPAILPDIPEAEEIRRRVKGNAGQQVKLPDGITPIPTILSNAQGMMYLPIYTQVGQIPKEPKFDVLMTMPFKACYTMVFNEAWDAKGLTVNPFSDNLIFPKEMLQAIDREEKMQAAGVKQVKVSPQQFKIMMRQKAEFHDLPKRIFAEGAEFIRKLSDEKEILMNEVYQNAFPQPDLYPYTAADFSVMTLNISENLLLVSVDLPPVKESAQLCYRIYITQNPENDEIHYFTVERGKEKGERNLGEVDNELKHIGHGEAPVEGAEIQRIIDIVGQGKSCTS